MSKDTGGPVWPSRTVEKSAKNIMDDWKEITTIVTDHSGMTLLDYFAGQAMADLLDVPESIPGEIGWEAWLAKTSYDIAEAMIAEKRKREASGE